MTHVKVSQYTYDKIMNGLAIGWTQDSWFLAFWLKFINTLIMRQGQ